MKFHHIGFLTKNLNKTQKEFSLIRYKKNSKIIDDKKLKVKILFIKNSNNLIEIVKPYNKNLGLLDLIEKKIFSYHFAYKTKKFRSDIQKLKKKFKMIVNPTPALAFNNKKVCFFEMPNGFIIELIEQ